MKRYEVAVEILEAVPNFASIARALKAAADEAAGEGIGAERDPAVRVIAYRLARLCRVDEISYGYDPTTLADTFCTLMNECKVRAKDVAGDELLFPLPEVFSSTKKIAYDRDPRIK